MPHSRSWSRGLRGLCLCLLPLLTAPGCVAAEVAAPAAPSAAQAASGVYTLSAGDGTIACEAGFAPAPRRLLDPAPAPYWRASELRRVEVALFRGAETPAVQTAMVNTGEIMNARFKFKDLGPNATYRVTVRGFGDAAGAQSIDACGTVPDECETTITTSDDAVVTAPSLKLRLGMKDIQ